MTGFEDGIIFMKREPDDLDKAELAAIRELFHRLILSRADEGRLPHPPNLPRLRHMRVDAKPRWFPVPGMYGGFSYQLKRDDGGYYLLADSWCRLADGSERRHRVTSSRIIEEESPLTSHSLTFAAADERL